MVAKWRWHASHRSQRLWNFSLLRWSECGDWVFVNFVSSKMEQICQRNWIAIWVGRNVICSLSVTEYCHNIRMDIRWKRLMSSVFVFKITTSINCSAASIVHTIVSLGNGNNWKSISEYQEDTIVFELSDIWMSIKSYKSIESLCATKSHLELITDRHDRSNLSQR